MTDPNTTASDDLVERVAKEVEGDIAEVIGDDAYDCLRVWSAWSYGTMGEDDFHPIIHDPARLREISTAAVRAVLALLQPRLDAADALLRAASPFHDLVDAWHHNLRFCPRDDETVFEVLGDWDGGVTARQCLALSGAVAKAKAAGIGGEK